MQARLTKLMVTGLMGMILGVPGRNATAQDAPPALSLADAIVLASRVGESISIASARVTDARSQQLAARSQYLPQVSISTGYTRTLASPYSDLTSGQSSSSGTDSSGAAPANGIDFAQVGFGAKNSYSATASGSLGLFTPGRAAQRASADAARRSAQVELNAQRAQTIVDVTELYYDAALADRLVAIAESSYTQAERLVRRVQVAESIGRQSGYELLRAQVTRDNQFPTLLQQRRARALAYVRLCNALNLEPGTPLRLSSAADLAPDTFGRVATRPSRDAPPPASVVRAAATVGVAMSVEPADTIGVARAAVRQAEESVHREELALRATREQRRPSVSLTGTYGKVAYPDGLVPSSLRTNASVGVQLSFPAFTGGRQRASELAAEAALQRTRAQLAQTRKAAVFDAQQVTLTLEQAEAAAAASAQTATQASRAYAISEARYREGIASQTEVTDARLAQAQALSNQAQAARDVLVARVRLALLSDLPLSTAATGSSATSSATTSATSATGTSNGKLTP